MQGIGLWTLENLLEGKLQEGWDCMELGRAPSK